jgi:DNA repair ATPase RecN
MEATANTLNTLEEACRALSKANHMFSNACDSTERIDEWLEEAQALQRAVDQAENAYREAKIAESEAMKRLESVIEEYKAKGVSMEEINRALEELDVKYGLYFPRAGE